MPPIIESEMAEPKRRETDHLDARLSVVEAEHGVTSLALQKHVSECAVLQKRVLVVGCLTLGWVVGTSPASSKIIGLLIKVL